MYMFVADIFYRYICGFFSIKYTYAIISIWNHCYMIQSIKLREYNSFFICPKSSKSLDIFSLFFSSLFDKLVCLSGVQRCCVIKFRYNIVLAFDNPLKMSTWNLKNWSNFYSCKIWLNELSFNHFYHDIFIRRNFCLKFQKKKDVRSTITLICSIESWWKLIDLNSHLFTYCICYLFLKFFYFTNLFMISFQISSPNTG